MSQASQHGAGRWETPLGVYEYCHIQIDLFFGYRYVDLGSSQYAFVALPEKALLDLIYLQPGGDKPAYLEELRLQNLEKINPNKLRDFARRPARPKLKRAAEFALGLREAEIKEGENL